MTLSLPPVTFILTVVWCRVVSNNICFTSILNLFHSFRYLRKVTEHIRIKHVETCNRYFFFLLSPRFLQVLNKLSVEKARKDFRKLSHFLIVIIIFKRITYFFQRKLFRSGIFLEKKMLVTWRGKKLLLKSL